MEVPYKEKNYLVPSALPPLTTPFWGLPSIEIFPNGLWDSGGGGEAVQLSGNLAIWASDCGRRTGMVVCGVFLRIIKAM